ncbi:MAG: hypothetical protein ACK53L_34480, partial [Pirellulaceae bacterium]
AFVGRVQGAEETHQGAGSMTDHELIKRLLFLAETAVDQALDLNYDDPEDYFIYRELRELKAVVEALPND